MNQPKTHAWSRVESTHTSSDTAMKSLSECSSSISCVPACSAEATPTGSGGPGGGTGEESAVKPDKQQLSQTQYLFMYAYMHTCIYTDMYITYLFLPHCT